MFDQSCDDSGTVTDPSMGTATALEQLARVVIDERPLTESLQTVTELAKTTLPGAAEVSITLMDGAKAWTVVFTGPLASSLDERQYAAGFGPCMDAATTGQTITVADDDTDSPYADFARLAARTGIHHILSVGLPVSARTIGGLNIYGTDQLPFDPDVIDMAERFAVYAGIAVGNVATYTKAVELVEHLQAAMKSRAVIEQAKGIIMERHHCSSEQAFTLISRTSQNKNIKLRDLALSLVSSVDHR